MSPAAASPRAALETRRAAGGRGLVPFLTAGYPDWDLFDRAVRILAVEGADVLELGIPFSDPLADGPTIQASSARALAAGVTVDRILEETRARGGGWGLPIVVMTYANPVLAYGPARFARDAQAAGIGGILVSDLPPEELPEVWEAFDREGLERVVLVAPTTSPERLPRIAGAANGYVYCLTRTGVTGRGGSFADNLSVQIEGVRRCTPVPVVAGFGIRAPEDAGALSRMADGIVVGARLIEILSEGSEEERLRNLRAFARGLRATLDRRGETTA